GFWTAVAAGLGAAAAALLAKGRKQKFVWQLDPLKCIGCGKCATHCVLNESAVKCVHAYAMCGYCDLCTGYFVPEPKELTTAAENQLCPTGAIERTFVEDPYFEYHIIEAIERTFVEDPYFEYHIIESLCIGCGKCVVGCNAFGNGSLFLQVRHDRCVNCNECAIAVACPSQAFKRVPIETPYIMKDA
ncbi:MAG: 4Fe-4S binding protein, partial [Planctomycetota bacterium]